MFAGSGVTDAMLARGYIVRNYQYRDRRTGIVADFDLGVLAGDTPYPYRLMLEQHKICYILLDLLKGYPDCQVLMEHRVTGVTQDGDGVTATVETPGGSSDISRTLDDRLRRRPQPGAQVHERGVLRLHL